MLIDIDYNMLVEIFVPGDKNHQAFHGFLQEKPYIDAGAPRVK